MPLLKQAFFGGTTAAPAGRKAGGPRGFATACGAGPASLSSVATRGPERARAEGGASPKGKSHLLDLRPSLGHPTPTPSNQRAPLAARAGGVTCAEGRAGGGPAQAQWAGASGARRRAAEPAAEQCAGRAGRRRCRSCRSARRSRVPSPGRRGQRRPGLGGGDERRAAAPGVRLTAAAGAGDAAPPPALGHGLRWAAGPCPAREQEEEEDTAARLSVNAMKLYRPVPRMHRRC
ncbi:RNA-binding motif protein, X chromosome-like [Ornithorhynchus anatinus]|uniref:RNA-binding motif protein, X chromosome-like n=1 Tax=Ornithorhynchus anatinus TaxID=9258 RepID=UPI0019D4AB4C|nr:RNA-binding motif protein, X chromosome-like [Ornithorhynchus anatinus]